MTTKAEKPLVFVSYSHKDEAWKEKLRPHLKALELAGRVTVWDDRKIDGGKAWYDEIRENMGRAGVAVCLISPDFLASDFCIKEEVAHFAVEREHHGMAVIPVLIRSCFWQLHSWLSETQMIPRDGKSLALDYPDEAAQDQQLAIVAETIFKIVDDPNYNPPSAAPSDWVPLADDIVDLIRLPTSGMAVVGRLTELAMLDEAWESDAKHILSLRAWGGVGKSTLVKHWCDKMQADNFRGARRVFAWSFYSQGTNDRVTSADLFINKALDFFGDDNPSSGSPWAKGERLAGLVGKEKALLILDGMEPLQDINQGIKDPALARLVECLAVDNTGLCVITTREPVKEFLDFPDTTQEVNLEQLSKEAGRALLRIEGLRAGDDLLERASEEFCNHALALNLLAKHLKHFAGGDVSQALAIPDLPSVTVDAGKHPRRVMAAYAEKLGEGPELELLNVMGLFDRPADAGCIASLRKKAAVPGLTERLSALDQIGWLDLLGKLRGFGLLAPASHYEPTELDAHPLVREHFGCQLRNLNSSAWRAGHLRIYNHLTSTVPEHPGSLAEMAPLLQAVRHGCHSVGVKAVHNELYMKRIQRGQDHYLTRSLGAYGADLAILREFIGDGESAAPRTDEGIDWGRIRHRIGYALRSIGQFEAAVPEFEAALKDAVKNKNWYAASVRASSLSILCSWLGKLKKARFIAEKGIEYAERCNDDYRRMHNYSTLAHIFHLIGETEESRKIFDKLESKYPDHNPWDYIVYNFRYCTLMLDLGENDKIIRRCIAIASGSASKTSIRDRAISHRLIGQAQTRSGQLGKSGLFAPALKHLDTSVRDLRLAGHLDELPRSHYSRGFYYRVRRQYDEAAADLDESIRLAKRTGMKLVECDAYIQYAALNLDRGRIADARKYTDLAQSLMSEIGQFRRKSEIADLRAHLDVG